MLVLCDLVRTTGAQHDLKGKILRVIPNKQQVGGTVNHYDFSEDYYHVSPKSSFFSVQLQLVSSRDYRVLNVAHPTSFTLHFKPVNQCMPLPVRTIV